MSDLVPVSALADVNPKTVVPLDKPVSFVGMDDVSESFAIRASEDVDPRKKGAGYTRFKEGDLLFAKITPCMENGKGAVAKGLTNGYALGSTEFHVLRCGDADTRAYLAQWLAFPQLRQTAEAHMTGSAGQRRVPAGFFDRFLIPNPPSSEKHRIAEILETVDDQIRDCGRVIAKLRRTRIGLLSALLGDRPRTWDEVICRDLCTEITVGIVVRPTQYYTDSGVPILRSANVRPDGLVLEDLKFMSELDHGRMRKTAVRPGDLVTVRTGYPGTTAVVPAELDQANCVDIIISRPGPRVLPDYLALWINSEFGKGQVLRAQGGLAQQHFRALFN